MTKKIIKKLPDHDEWTFKDIQQYYDVIRDIAEEFGLDYFPNQLEIITYEQMLDAYSSVGLPVTYNHWKFGKTFSSYEEAYKKGNTSLAYELVINSSPCIAYLMDQNDLVTQALVMAHASFGHNSFFKGNFLFKEWTFPKAIVEYSIFARDYIAECETKYGFDAVEETLDACHALQMHGVDKYKRPPKLFARQERELQKKRMEEEHRFIYEFWNTLPKKNEEKKKRKKFPAHPQENILKFLQRHSPILEPWQREILRIVRNLAQYFYPQSQTKLMNEGWSTFMHNNIILEMNKRGYLTDKFMQTFHPLNTAVAKQPSYRNSGQFNPYHLGLRMYQDIERMCKEPTEEDKEWFPYIAGSDSKETLQHAMKNFKDESFILQYLSPKLMRDYQMFMIFDDSQKPKYDVTHVSNSDGYKQMRRLLAHQYDRSYQVPDIQIVNADIDGDRTLTLHYYPVNNIPLQSEDKVKVIEHIEYLWGFDVQLETVGEVHKKSAPVPMRLLGF